VSFLYFPAAVAVEGKRTYDGLGKTFNYLLARRSPRSPTSF
jgi:hypothetical protein